MIEPEITLMEFYQSGAVFSPDRRYRYDLWRLWERNGKRINFIGLNPSTANEASDDPTIRRCVAFAKSWGYGEMHMLNLFAFISNDPRKLCWPNPDPIGLENDAYFNALQSPVVAAWGSWKKLHIGIEVRARTIERMFENLFCLGTNADGEPKHPLYLPSSSQLIKYRGGTNE